MIVQKDFVRTVRAVEYILGIGPLPQPASSGDIAAAFPRAAEAGVFSDKINFVLRDAAPVLFQMVLEYGSLEMLNDFLRPGKEPLTTKYV